jgi:hypothetical protein
MFYFKSTAELLRSVGPVARNAYLRGRLGGA